MVVGSESVRGKGSTSRRVMNERRPPAAVGALLEFQKLKWPTRPSIKNISP